MLFNTTRHYGLITKGLHWGIALCLAWMFASGWGLLPKGVPHIHKALGITVLMLVAFRVVWRIMAKVPVPVPSLKPYEYKAAHVVHISLYGFMLAMPITGWLMTSAYGKAVSFFGIWNVPVLMAKNKPVASLMNDLHEIGAVVFIMVIGVHIAAALYHHVIRKDEVLLRML